MRNKKITLLAGLLLSMTTVMQAQTLGMTSYLPKDGEDYRGYCIEQAKFEDLGEGYLAAGSRTKGGSDHNSVHLLCMQRENARNAKGQLLYFPQYDDVRAIALTMLEPNHAALLVQVRKFNGEVHPVVVLLDVSTPGNAIIQKTMQLSSEGQFPTSMCLSPDKSKIYIAGFVTSGSFNPQPSFPSAKTSFVASIDLSSGTVDMNRFNTPQVSTSDNDYDMIQRVRFIKDRLYVIGSVNDKSSGYTTSKAWVAELKPDGLSIIQQNSFGNDNFSPQGFQGVDMVRDELNTDNYYVVGNDYYWHTWTLSRLDASLKITTGGSNYKNTVTYAYSADIKGCGVLAHNDGRITVYGNMRAGFPAAPSGVASFNAGAVPFLAGFDPAIDPYDGLKATHLTWFNEGNLPSTATGLQGRYTPYWINSPDLSYWGDPAFALLTDVDDPYSGIALMGHVGYKLPNLAPKLIQADKYGKTGCDASVDVTDQVEPGVVSIALKDVPVAVTENNTSLSYGDVAIELEEMPHEILNCSDDKYYRTPQATGIATTTNSPLLLQSLAPNPATDAVTLQWNGSLQEQDVLRLELTDIAGRKVGEASLLSRSTASGSFALPQLAPGLYVANLYVNGQARGQQKLSIR